MNENIEIDIPIKYLVNAVYSLDEDQLKYLFECVIDGEFNKIRIVKDIVRHLETPPDLDKAREILKGKIHRG